MQEIIKQDIATTADTIKNKLLKNPLLLPSASEINNTKEKLNQLNLSREDWATVIDKVYTPNELEKLQNQELLVKSVKAKINALIDDNANIPELFSLQKDLNRVRKELTKPFGEHIKDCWGKIKSVFKKSNTKKLQQNKLRIDKAISGIDNKLEVVITKIEQATELRRKKLEAQLGILGTSKYRYILDHQGHRELPKLMQEFEELDQKMTASLMNAAESMYLGEQSKSTSRSTDVSLSTPIQDKTEHIYENIQYTTHPIQKTPDNTEHIYDEVPDIIHPAQPENNYKPITQIEQ